MFAVVAVALALSWGSAIERLRRSAGCVSLDGLLVVTAAWLSVLGVATTLLATVGSFGAVSTSIASGLGAALVWPWRLARPPRQPIRWKRWAIAGGLLLLGLGLRWPVLDYPLAGRDQGTYTLRAQHTLRTGSLHAVDPVLEDAADQIRQRSGPADLQGLYHRRTEPWRRDRYEAAYRPGFYLADLDRGRVQPQFLHLHPMLMATTGLVLGPSRVAMVSLLYAALSILALWSVARRLWPRGGWALVAGLLWATAPLSIWVLRTPLSEGLASVLVLSALLAVLRARDDGPGWLELTALLLGALAWARGNGWLAAPVLLAAQWLVPTVERRARRASLTLAGMVMAAVLVHAPTTYPYLHDELLRQLPLPAGVTPMVLITMAAAGLATWFAIDELGPLRRTEDRWLPPLCRAAPWVLVVLLLGAVVAYLGLRVEPLAKPFSRLDPVLPLCGPAMLVLAAIGLGTVVRRWPNDPSAVHAWLLGLAGVLVVTVALYAQRNLPRLGLYYYGRYLVPDLLPVLLLLAVEGLRTLHRLIAGTDAGRGRGRVATALAIVGAMGLGWSSAGVLVQTPVTRLPEFAGAARVVDHLAERLEPDAVVIAGGEGWHHGHTFNQVGGALAFRHGISVLPYRTREAAYASLVELLIGRPAATGEPAPPVYLLVNEATKHRMRDRKDPEKKVRISGIDDLLPPPFVARRIDLVEMFLDRLTPTHDGPPVRVTRDGLRMALMRIEVDPARMAQLESWTTTAEGDAWVIEGSPGLRLEGGEPKDGAPCLGTKPLTITIPPTGAAGPGPVSVVVVASPGVAARTSQWTLEIDGNAVSLGPTRMTPRRRDTLGPIALTRRPRQIVVKGSGKKLRRARCPHGGIAEVRLLGPEAPMLRDAETTAITFAPAEELGHPVTPVTWVSGRGLSRYRQGIEPTPEIKGLTLVVGPQTPVRFAPAPLPDGGEEELEVVVTITGAALDPNARLWVTIDGETLPPIDPPDERRGSWQSEALRWSPRSSTAQIEVELRDAAPGDHVLLRDIGLFSRALAHRGQLVEH